MSVVGLALKQQVAFFLCLVWWHLCAFEVTEDQGLGTSAFFLL